MADSRTEKARRIAQSRVLPGEKLVWWDVPRGGPGRTVAGLGSVIFMLLWTLFALAWTGLSFLFTLGADEQTDLIFKLFPLFGVPFILVGVIGLVGSLRGLGGESYALTDRRVLVIRGKNMQEYVAADFRSMERTGGDARGSIGFAHSSIESGAKPLAWFYNIDDPAGVEALIRKHLLWH